jgi:hypothetical protein
LGKASLEMNFLEFFHVFFGESFVKVEIIDVFLDLLPEMAKRVT